MNRCAALVVALCCSTLPACRPTRIAAPYGVGQGPSVDALLAASAPKLQAVQVSEAKVVANRVLRGNLAFVAQAPARFRGTVGISGNELVTLAFSEAGYGLRYKLDAFPVGFYAGPPSSCAVEALIGIAIDEDDLVALVLGGAPVIAAPYRSAGKGWNSKLGVEVLELSNERYVEELHFVPSGRSWQFVAARLWERKPDGGRGRRLWSLAHEELERVGDTMLPARTRISAPGKRKENLVVINYRKRDTNPAFAAQAGGTAGNGGADDGGDVSPDEGGWGEDDSGGWEGAAPDDEGWEGGGAGPGVTKADAADQPAEPPAPPASEPPTKVPTVFVIDGAGLSARGDLCRTRP